MRARACTCKCARTRIIRRRRRRRELIICRCVRVHPKRQAALLLWCCCCFNMRGFIRSAAAVPPSPLLPHVNCVYCYAYESAKWFSGIFGCALQCDFSSCAFTCSRSRFTRVCNIACERMCACACTHMTHPLTMCIRGLRWLLVSVFVYVCSNRRN